MENAEGEGERTTDEERAFLDETRAWYGSGEGRDIDAWYGSGDIDALITYRGNHPRACIMLRSTDGVPPFDGCSSTARTWN